MDTLPPAPQRLQHIAAAAPMVHQQAELPIGAADLLLHRLQHLHRLRRPAQVVLPSAFPPALLTFLRPAGRCPVAPQATGPGQQAAVAPCRLSREPPAHPRTAIRYPQPLQAPALSAAPVLSRGGLRTRTGSAVCCPLQAAAPCPGTGMAASLLPSPPSMAAAVLRALQEVTEQATAQLVRSQLLAEDLGAAAVIACKPLQTRPPHPLHQRAAAEAVVAAGGRPTMLAQSPPAEAQSVAAVLLPVAWQARSPGLVAASFLLSALAARRTALSLRHSLSRSPLHLRPAHLASAQSDRRPPVRLR